MDIVEKEGKPVAKRGKFSGRKRVYRCSNCLRYKMLLWDETSIPRCKCGEIMGSIMKKYLDSGKPTGELPSPKETRLRVLEQLDKLDIDWLEE